MGLSSLFLSYIIANSLVSLWLIFKIGMPKLIKFKGYEPGKDIAIKITGLRPGEKLYEELLMDEEGLKETPNKLIHIGRPIEMNDNKFFKDLDKLIECSLKNDKNIKDKVAKVVKTYKVDKGNGSNEKK